MWWNKVPKDREKGQSLVEFALTLPLVLLLVLGTIDLGLGFKTYIALTNAAREGVRWVSIHPTDLGCAGALNRIADEAGQVNLVIKSPISTDGYEVSFSPLGCDYGAGQQVTVSIDYEYELLFGALTGLPAVPFNASATMVVLYDE
jgi:hypothetical protein